MHKFNNTNSKDSNKSDKMVARYTKTILMGLFILGFSFVLPISKVMAQQGSLNAYSPYTMYGLGDLQQVSSAQFSAMAGIGVGVRDSYSFNYANPASLSAIPQRSAILNFGGQSKNMYSRTELARTSYNNVNLHDFGFAFPLARGIGFGVALLPYTSVGYSNVLVKENNSITENIGKSVYTYEGEGGISQLQAGVGIQVARGLSVGINGHYYFGNINRFYSSVVYSYLNNDLYRAINSYDVHNVNTFTYEIGVQYQFRVGYNAGISLGATYQSAAHTKMDKSLTQLAHSNLSSDTVSLSQSQERLVIPEKISGGIYFFTDKVGLGFDYIYQNWSNSFDPNNSRISLRQYQEFKLGFSYTPNRGDTRRALNRWTYKAGVRYGTSYMSMDNHLMTDCAATIGFDIPMRRAGLSKVSVGAEVGRRGTVRNGQIEETYFRIVAGFSLFGEDMWFTRVKFD